ncbi:Hypothetical predicted protein [Olea europaea subsp. europaea]|uniref:Uncharacterized protein n=1 Tax=Olea europaea subsp. europaea TaxID=158383 RepID=A0A8S0PL50_OLEEU|nr:Hypothetical predicted protein [Olea europaea subsp. europaea]
MGRLWVTVGTQPDFHAFLEFFGHDVQATSGMRPDRGTHPDFQVFLSTFWNTVCRQCSGRVWAMEGMQPSFQVFLGSFWDTVCRPCPGCRKDTSWFLSISRQFLGHSVQAIFGTRQAAAGIQPDFSTFLGSFWDTMCKP